MSLPGIISLLASFSRFNLARLSRGIMVLWQRNTPMIAYVPFAFNHRLNEDNSLDKKSDVIGDLSYMIAVRITRYMVVTRRRQLTFTIIYRRVIKFPVAVEGHNPGTNKVHIKQASRITASFTRNRLNFWNQCQSPYEVVHFPELIAIYEINSNARDVHCNRIN